MLCVFWGADLWLRPSVDVSHPESQEVLVSNWEPAHNLVEDAISGAEIAPCLHTVHWCVLPVRWGGFGFVMVLLPWAVCLVRLIQVGALESW